MKKTLLFVLLIVWKFSALAQDSISVLFIGNSYTYVNDLPVMTQQLAQSLGKQLTVGSKTNGGFTFQNHWSDPQTYTAIHQQNWDIVVLQAQSQEPSFPADQVATATTPYAINLSDSVYAALPCSEVMYFMTWGRENGDSQWDSINTFNKMNQRLYNAYMNFASITDGMVSPVGATWKYVRDNYPSIQLYSGDGSHPSLAGSYLAACTFYTALFRSPTNGASYLGGLDSQTAGILQQAADHVVLDSLDHFMLHPVNEHEQAYFTFTATGNSVQFTNNSLHATTYEWLFGDGTFSNEENPSHDFASNGSYTVTLIVHGNCGSDTTSQTVIIESAGIASSLASGLELIEYDDHFAISHPKTIYYEIYSFDGKIIASGNILTPQNEVIKKAINYGFLLIGSDDGLIYQKTFIYSHK